VTIICTTCFVLRAALLIFSTVDRAMDVNDLFIGGYYFVVEILPSALVLFILRKLPPKRDPHKENPILNSYSRLTTHTYDRYTPDHYQVKIDVN